MNFIKKHLLERELMNLQGQQSRFFAISSIRADIELERNSSFPKRLWNGFLYHRTGIEYDSLRDKMPRIDSRIEEIQIELRNYR